METATSGASAVRPAGRGLWIGLWVVQVLLALFSLMAGINHGIRPIEEAAKSSPWITGVPVGLARFIGFAEIAAAVGLILPAATRIRPWLTPLAAVGLAIIMALAIPFHIMRGEANVIGLHAIVVALSLFVVWGRFRKAPIAPRGS
jgi:putative oxidoreductase